MTILKIFDYLTIASLAFLSYGVLSQWHYIFKSKSIRDIVVQDVLIRWIATLVLLIKIVFVGDLYLIIGQSIFSLAISTYALTLLYIKSRYKQ
ncbi:MAG: hypothetical protein AAB584_00355 [Patescibacteria group bacterium]